MIRDTSAVVNSSGMKNVAQALIPQGQRNAGRRAAFEESRKGQAHPGQHDHPDRPHPGPERIHADDRSHLEAEREQQQDAEARQDIDPVRGLEVVSPLLERQMRVENVESGLKHAPLAAEPVCQRQDMHPLEDQIARYHHLAIQYREAGARTPIAPRGCFGMRAVAVRVPVRPGS